MKYIYQKNQDFDTLFIRFGIDEYEVWTMFSIRFQHPYCTIHTDFCDKNKNWWSGMTECSKDEFNNALYRALSIISEQGKE